MKRAARFFCTIALVAGCNVSVLAGTISIQGSDTFLPLIKKLAETYMSENPGVKIDVRGGGPNNGFTALQQKTTDLCDSTRKPKPAEIAGFITAFGRRPAEYKVALEGLSIYVNEENPVKELTVDQLGKIFSGKITNWKEVGGLDTPIVIYSLERNSSLYEMCREQILHGHDFPDGIQLVSGTSSMLSAVSRSKGGIGYGNAGLGKNVRALLVKKNGTMPAVAPTGENLENKPYALWRYLYVYVNPAQNKGETSSYLNWICSDEGQKVVKEAGYYPLPEHLRE